MTPTPLYGTTRKLFITVDMSVPLQLLMLFEKGFNKNGILQAA